MIIEQHHAARAASHRYGTCVIGSGPAGATVATELAKAGSTVCVLESGGAERSDLADELREVVSEGIEIKLHSRERVLGGTSTTWAGLSAPLDPIDLAPRPEVGIAGWPLSYEELLPYYERASERFGFATLEELLGDGLGAARQATTLQPSWELLCEKVFMAAAEPANFGPMVSEALASSANSDLYLDATVIRLRTDSEGSRVLAVEVMSPLAGRFTVHADRFVVATGAIENARLLLVSGDGRSRGVGNDNDLVGRYLMNHPKYNGGVIRFSEPVTEAPLYFGAMTQGFAGFAGLRLTNEAQRREGVLNSYARLEPRYPWTDVEGVEAVVALAKSSKRFMARWSRRSFSEVVPMRTYAETGDEAPLRATGMDRRGWARAGTHILRDLPAIARYGLIRSGVRRAPGTTAARLRNFLEMEPRPQNRVTLSGRRDRFGVPLPVAGHSLSELDVRSIKALHHAVDTELRRLDLGSLTAGTFDELGDGVVEDASHHLGTTRMGHDPATSVVDPDCRVHGVDNLYLAGGSVFPTSGNANPTYTIVALALRLSAHLGTLR